MSEEFHRKYRPSNIDDIVGQDHIVKSLGPRIAKNDVPHTILFTGPAGCGKTTLGRIIAKAVGCDEGSIIEIDAATHTGIDAMRDLQDQVMYRGFGDSGTKVIIVDEVHGLSGKAFDSILKATEEPKDHVYWVLCTTEAGKIPKTIKTRCHSYDLKPVGVQDIEDVLDMVCEEEGIKLEGRSLNIIARNSDGSLRQALVFLSMAQDCKTSEDVEDVIQSCDSVSGVIDLCKLMVGRQTPQWPKMRDILKDLRNENPESIRIVICNYFTGCLLNTKTLGDAERFVDILEAFSRPCTGGDKITPIVLGIFDTIYAD